MFGKIKYAQMKEITEWTQKTASAWHSISLVGASYTPVLFVGTQQAKGVNYIFLAKETLLTNPPFERLVKIVVNEFEGHYDTLGVEEIA